MSDRLNGRPIGFVIGTAGHIDHGKTSLVYALTGIDTDRLQEEKRRGISIDLGFAHLTLPDGQTVGLVDVPGHERFIKNMLAGVGGMEAVVLVVAADESVKPQTREHFEICRLLHIRTGVIAITKCELADEEQLERVRADVRALCAGSFLEDAATIPVSARTGFGIEALREAIGGLIRKRAGESSGQVTRLPVDRSFGVSGFGTVVTGTLRGGSLAVGEAVELHPSRVKPRIRGLEVYGAPVQVAGAGHRTGVNLSGIESSQAERGFTLTSIADVESSTMLDVSVEWLNTVENQKPRQQIVLHVGTSEVVGSLKMLGGAYARILLRDPVLVFPGDRFVLRRPSPAETIAGGMVVDAFPPMRLSRANTVLRLARLVNASDAERVRFLVDEAPQGRRIPELVKMSGLTKERVIALVENDGSLLLARPAMQVVSREWIEQKRQAIVSWLKEFHQQEPGLEGAPMARLKAGLDASLANAVFHGFSEVVVKGDVAALATHRKSVNAVDTQKLSRMEMVFRQAAFQPPALDEVFRLNGSDAKQARSFLETLIRAKRLVRVSADLVFHVDAIQGLRATLSAQKGRKFSVSDFKTWTNISRKYAIPLLEYLDRERVTRRDGDSRIVLQ